MKRFMGMMPSVEVEKKGDYKDCHGYLVHIDAGPHGWTVMWHDQSTNYKDVDASTEDNFKAAKDFAEAKVGTLTEFTKPPMGEM